MKTATSRYGDRSKALWLAFLLAGLTPACGGANFEAADVEQEVSADAGAPTGSAVQSLTLVCGAAGQGCCAGGTCNAGLVCNDNYVCRTPCGALGQRCCSGQLCNDGLTCDSTGTCRTKPPPPPPDPTCVPCATRVCGWDSSCGPNYKTYCGSCPAGATCNSIGQCGSATGDPPPLCTLTCPTGQTCMSDFYGQYCGLQP